MKYFKSISKIFILTVFFFASKTSGQLVTVYSENFSGYTNCTQSNAPAWTTTFADSDDPTPGCTSGQSFWGVFNGEFRCNDIEGPGQNNLNTFTTDTFSITCLQNVTISFDARHTGTLECGGGANSHDEIVAYYSLNGGAWVQFANVCGSNGLPATLSVSGLTGNTIALRITMGNKANPENYYLDDILITGEPIQFADAGVDQNICNGGSIQLNASGGQTYLWNTSPTLSCLACSNPIATPIAPTEYIVTVTDANGCIDDDTVLVGFGAGPAVDLGNDTMLCAGQSLTLDAQNPGASFIWQDSTTNQTLITTGPGVYHVEVSLGGCVENDTIIILPGTTPQVDLGNDTVVCANPFNINFDVTQPGASYMWHNNHNGSTFAISNPGVYWVQINNACGSATDSIVVSQDSLPIPNLGNDTLICAGSFLLNYDMTIPGGTYLWEDNSTASIRQIDQPGTYWVDVTNACGTVSDTINIQQSGVINVDLGADQSICNGDFITLDAFSPFANSYLWQDGSSNDQFVAYTAGQYYVDITTDCGIFSDSINITLIPDLTNTLDRFTGSCGDLEVNIDLSSVFPGAQFLWSNGDTSPSSSYYNSGREYVEISRCNEVLVDSFTIEISSDIEGALFIPNVFTPNGDGINDYYKIEGVFDNVHAFHCDIFNRWGELLFSSDDYNFRWDGTYRSRQVQEGVYVMVVQLEQHCGSINVIQKRTHITLVR